jgi:hypothetical protein
VACHQTGRIVASASSFRVWLNGGQCGCYGDGSTRNTQRPSFQGPVIIVNRGPGRVVRGTTQAEIHNNNKPADYLQVVRNSTKPYHEPAFVAPSAFRFNKRHIGQDNRENILLFLCPHILTLSPSLSLSLSLLYTDISFSGTIASQLVFIFTDIDGPPPATHASSLPIRR